MTIFIWLILAPNMKAQTNKPLINAAPVTSQTLHAPSNTQAAKLAHTGDITFTPSFTAYLPFMSKFVPELTGTISGQITNQGTPIGGVSVTLFLWYNATTYSRFLTTTTQADGSYQFTGVPKLTNYYYRVLYENLTQSPAYVFGCAGQPIFNFPAGASAPGGNFEISDITLLSPANGATISPPYVFQWARRVTTSDDYAIDIEGQSAYWQSSQLGYVEQYTLNSLAGTNLTAGTLNTWSVSLNASDGGGCSARESRTVTFTNTSLVQFPLPTMAWHVGLDR
jgi:hypothetical protein